MYWECYVNNTSTRTFTPELCRNYLNTISNKNFKTTRTYIASKLNFNYKYSIGYDEKNIYT